MGVCVMMYLFQFDIRCVFFTVFYSTCGITYSVESTVESLNKQPDVPHSELSVMISNISTCVQIQLADKQKIVLQGGRLWKQLCSHSGRPIMMLMMMMIIAFWVLRAELTRSSAIAQGPRDAPCQLKFCQLPCNSAETTYTTSPDQIDGMKLEI